METITITKNNVKAKLGVSCIICGEFVPLSEKECLMVEHGLHMESKVCDKCKAAVMEMRKYKEEKDDSKK